MAVSVEDLLSSAGTIHAIPVLASDDEEYESLANPLMNTGSLSQSTPLTGLPNNPPIPAAANDPGLAGGSRRNPSRFPSNNVLWIVVVIAVLAGIIILSRG